MEYTRTLSNINITKRKDMKSIVLITICLALISCSQDQNNDNPTTTPKNYDLETILNGWGKSFVSKIDESYNAIVNFHQKDQEKDFHIIISELKYSIEEGVNDSANFTFNSTLHHYNKIFIGEMTALTSMGQATSSDSIPLEPDIHKPIADDGNALNDFLFFSQRFFNTSPFDKVILREENSRVVHGGHAIPNFLSEI